MASGNDHFSISGPTFLTRIDWTNAHHRRSVAASLVKGVYMLEGDRQDGRRGPECLALPWSEFFHFRYIAPLTESDECIFGAIFEFKPWDCSYHFNIHESPRYVIAFRGTLIKLGSLARDIQLDIDIIRNGLYRTSRSAIAINTVRDTVTKAGNSKVWLTGHSQGASIAMLAGKTMAKSGMFLESFLFNPPYILAPIERIGDETLKHGIRFAGTIIKAGVAFANAKNDKNKDSKTAVENKDPFAAICGWIPCLFVNREDPICSEYIGYFEHRRKLESFGFGGKSIARQTSQSSLGNLVLNAVGVQGVESSEPLHLLPSANLTVNLSSCPSQDFKQAHGLCQWWRPDLDLKCDVYKYN
ncbi:GDSL esterase/lipase [Hibiscus syriacus]|uniref:GDSL esterase/lipase n=1 Tax=Hibiscus syriacus TaxID=106335 RepID=A0A6A3CJ09_HIBSY|nr:GDSL esterase/lipase At4g10955-like [Hibiscus syriacus]KAE8728494.1 GDSL esterase/lipase [Hibiscus syriacus]